MTPPQHVSGTSPTPATLRVATRASALATAQAQWCADHVSRATGMPTELVEVTTFGDISRQSLTSIGGVGVFAAAVRDAVLQGEADFAVHSAKDLPTAPVPGLRIACVPPREDARDVLISRNGETLYQLPQGARVGTGSPRRAAQLHALGLGLDVIDIRGNVDTRLGMVTNGDLDAVVLAKAGLSRLGKLDVISEVFDPLLMLPAAGQGFLALECREDDDRIIEALSHLHDDVAGVCLAAERAVLAALGAGCSAPVAAYAECAEGDDGMELFVRAAYGLTEPDEVVRRSVVGSLAVPQQLGHDVAELLIAAGAPAPTSPTQVSREGHQ